MEGEKSILDEIRETGEDVDIYGISTRKEIGPRRVVETDKSRQGYIVEIENDNKNKIGKEKVKKKVTKCTIKGCKQCSPQNAEYLTKEEYDLGIRYKREVGDTVVPMYIKPQNYGVQPKMKPNEYLKESSDNAVFPDEEEKFQNHVISSNSRIVLDAEPSDLRVQNNLITQGNEKKWIKCTNKGCKECSKYHSGLLQEQVDNYNKQDISVEKYDHRKMSEAYIEDFVVPASPLSPVHEKHRSEVEIMDQHSSKPIAVVCSEHVLTSATSLQLETLPKNAIPKRDKNFKVTEDQQEGVVSGTVKKVELDLKRQSDSTITSSTLEKKSSQDLRTEQICPKMKKEENAATRSHILHSNFGKLNSHTTLWPKLPREGDRQKRSAGNTVIDFQKDPEERMRNVWYYSCLPANLYCKCFLIVFLILILVIVGVFIFMIYNNQTTEVIEMIHHQY